MKKHQSLAAVGWILGIGLIGAILAGDDFAPQVGGMVGLFVGVAYTIYETWITPKRDRDRHFTMYVRGGLPGGLVKQDSRIVIPFTLLIVGALSTALWQIVYLLLFR